MYYLDNAATTYPKPKVVRDAMGEALTKYGANPGRGGHDMAFSTSEMVFRCRETAAEFFGASLPEQVIFTPNCTTSLNMVIKGVLKHGGRALISDVEHNAVVRPLHALSTDTAVYDVVKTDITDPEKTLYHFRSAIRSDTRLIVCTHASNVLGNILPVREIGALARRMHIPFAVDAAQTGGVLPIDMQKDNVDFLCVAGHKGLYGPMGTGMLLTSDQYALPSFVQGGTGSRSMDPMQPEELPDRLESGTPNTVGICGLLAAMEWVKSIGVHNIRRHEQQCAQRLYSCLRAIPQAEVYTPFPRSDLFVPLVSFNFKNVPSEETARLLNEQGVAVRAGLHCAPLAHRKMGTTESGAVRLAPSVFTNAEQVESVCKILRQTAQKTLQ